MQRSRMHNPESASLMSALETLKDVLYEANIKFAVIGGLAFGHYVEIRGTKDIDIIIATKGVSDATEVFNLLQGAGFRPATKESGKLQIGHLDDIKAYTLAFWGPSPLQVRVDVIASMDEFYNVAVSEAEYDEKFGVHIVPLEAFIVLKAASLRARIVSSDPETRRRGIQDNADYEFLIAAPNIDKNKLRWYSTQLGVPLDRIDL